VQAGGSATHEGGSGDLLDTGRAHALARRRGEGTTSQHFERCVYLRVGEVWEVGGVTGGVDLQQKQQSPKQKPGASPRRLAELVARSPKPRPSRILPTKLRAFLLRLPIPKCFASVN